MKEEKVQVVIFIATIAFALLCLIYKPTEESPEQREWRENEIALAELKSYMEQHPEEFQELEVDKDTRRVVTVTVYNPVASQCDSSPLVTADLSKIDLEKLENGELKWIAISRDLLDVFSYGDRVRISGNADINGIYEVHDTMNKRYTNYIDILMPEDSVKLGKWKNIIIEKVI